MSPDQLEAMFVWGGRRFDMTSGVLNEANVIRKSLWCKIFGESCYVIGRDSADPKRYSYYRFVTVDGDGISHEEHGLELRDALSCVPAECFDEAQRALLTPGAVTDAVAKVEAGDVTDTAPGKEPSVDTSDNRPAGVDSIGR